MGNMTKGHNGGTQYDHSGGHATEFFSKAGSLLIKRGQHYGGEASALSLFQDVWRTGDSVLAMKLLFWLRDPRGGAGNRSGFRACATWLAKEDPAWIVSNIHNIPRYGRWDDLQSLYEVDETALAASTMWANEILCGDGLAAKWANRKDKKLLKAVRKLSSDVKDIGDFRRLLAKHRKGCVEVAMASKNYSKVDYSKVPGVAMARYSAAFGRNDSERYEAYKARLEKAIEKGDPTIAKINTGALFPHDVIRTMEYGDKKVADLQFESLPNFMEEADARILTLADTSWSMNVTVSGEIRAMDVAKSLAFYCSDKIGKDNPFYRKFMEFCSESRLIDWSKHKRLSDAYNAGLFKNNVGSTNISGALDTILAHGKMFSATKEQMPTHLLIVSDMQFDQGTHESSSNDTVVQAALKKWVEAGYDTPSVIYWNTNGNSGSPERSKSKNVGMVSGFSPSVLKAVFKNPESMNPFNIMMEAIKDYEVITPSNS